MKLTPIPYSFIRERVLLSWRDALWGYERQLIGWSDVVDIAGDRLLLDSDNPLEIELSCLEKSEAQQVGELLHVLANNEPDEAGSASDKKWLFLVLAWLFENKGDVPDPLSEVESIYADFDYPPEIEGFVSYMPVTDGYDPSKHSIDENKARLFSKWEQYLSEARQEVGIGK
jgi:hypothetical protein